MKSIIGFTFFVLFASCAPVKKAGQIPSLEPAAEFYSVGPSNGPGTITKVWVYKH